MADNVSLFLFREVLDIDTPRFRFGFLYVAETFSDILIRGPINCVCVSFLIFFFNSLMHNWRRKIRVNLFSMIWFSSSPSSRTIAYRICDNVWLHRCQGFSKLLETDFCITIKIKPPHYCNKLLFDCAVTNSLQESSDCLFIDISEIQRINCFECSTDAKFFKLL